MSPPAMGGYRKISLGKVSHFTLFDASKPTNGSEMFTEKAPAIIRTQ
jgi:hypothetical protein